MKIRYGFVSNSSSSNFCIAKCYMTEKQIEDMRKMIEFFGEESEKYFYGTYSTEDIYSDFENNKCDKCAIVNEDECAKCNPEEECEDMMNNFDTFLGQFGEDCADWGC